MGLIPVIYLSKAEVDVAEVAVGLALAARVADVLQDRELLKDEANSNYYRVRSIGISQCRSVFHLRLG